MRTATIQFALLCALGIMGCTTSDSDGPVTPIVPAIFSIKLDHPTANAVVKGDDSMTASVQGGVGKDRTYKFYVKDSLVGTSSTPSLPISWSSFQNGTYAVKVVATTSANETAEDTETVTVQNLVSSSVKSSTSFLADTTKEYFCGGADAKVDSTNAATLGLTPAPLVNGSYRCDSNDDSSFVAIRYKQTANTTSPNWLVNVMFQGSLTAGVPQLWVPNLDANLYFIRTDSTAVGKPPVYTLTASVPGINLAPMTAYVRLGSPAMSPNSLGFHITWFVTLKIKCVGKSINTATFSNVHFGYGYLGDVSGKPKDVDLAPTNTLVTRDCH